MKKRIQELSTKISELHSQIKEIGLQLKPLEEELEDIQDKEAEKETKRREKKGIVINTDENGKEWFTIPEEWIDDFTDEDCVWDIKGEKFTYVDKHRVNGDGEWWGIIVKREKDNKHFEFHWGYSHGSGNYYYNETWREVRPTKEVKTKWE